MFIKHIHMQGKTSSVMCGCEADEGVWNNTELLVVSDSSDSESDEGSE